MVVLVLVATIVIAGLLLLACLLAAYYLAETMTRTKRWRVEGNPADMLLRHDEVAFVAADGVGTRGWYLESPGARATIVLVHDAAGTRSDPTQGLLDLQRDYLRRGLNVLSFDLRGRGESEGHHDHLGAAELADVEAAIAYARRRGPLYPLVLHGFGMGAALALMIAARDPGVAGVIADSPFASMRSHLRREYEHWPVLVFLLAVWLARRLFHADIDAVTPILVIPQLTQPVFYIHAEEDPEVPVEHTLNLGAASLNADDRIWLAPVSKHCGAYRANPTDYVSRCLGFIEVITPARQPLSRAR